MSRANARSVRCREPGCIGVTWRPGEEPYCTLHRLERSERRVATLERRLARVLRAATWAHNVHAREGFKGLLREYGCVWSGKRRAP